jgi:hypothetical protein
MASTGNISGAFSFWAYFCFVKTAFLVIFVLKSELLRLPQGSGVCPHDIELDCAKRKRPWGARDCSGNPFLSQRDKKDWSGKPGFFAAIGIALQSLCRKKMR